MAGGGGGWMQNFTKLMLNSTPVEVVAGVELGNSITLKSMDNLLLLAPCKAP